MKKVFSYNMKNIIKFEFIFKILSAIIFTPLFLYLFNSIMRITGYNYLTLENIFSFLLNPITIILLICLIFILTIYSLFDIGVIITLIDASFQKKEISLKDAIKYSFWKSVKVFKKDNILLVVLVLLLIPFLNIGITSSFISSIKIPEFILDYIFGNNLLYLIYVCIVFLLIFLQLRWIYSLHYYFIENKNFKEARIKSINLGNKRHCKDLLKILLTQLFITIMYLLFVFIGIFLIIVLNKLFNNIIGTFMITILWLFIAISFIITVLLSNVINYTIISDMYYKNKESIKEKINHIHIKSIEKKKKSKQRLILDISIILVIVIGLTIFTSGTLNGKYKLNIEYIRNIEVTAHRGASVDFPENTLSAFIEAKRLGSDWIELDVQQTKDNEIIITHDSNLKRTTGKNINTWDATYEEISKLDAGSFKDKKFKGEKIPLLEDIIKWAKSQDIKLNIELKPTGHEINFEKNVLDIIKKYDFIDNCVVTSQNYKTLENIKAIDDNVTTVYVMSLAYGDIKNLDKADHFSISSSSITKSLVDEIHESGKLIYGWTVNTKESINRIIDLKVDNIITDNVTLAKDLVFKSKNSNIINEYIKFVQNIF